MKDNEMKDDEIKLIEMKWYWQMWKKAVCSLIRHTSAQTSDCIVSSCLSVTFQLSVHISQEALWKLQVILRAMFLNWCYSEYATHNRPSWRHGTAASVCWCAMFCLVLLSKLTILILIFEVKSGEDKWQWHPLQVESSGENPVRHGEGG